MHMSDSLVSPAVGAVMFAASGVAVAYSVAKVKAAGFDGKKVAQTCALGAFVFAAQAVNFAIPATGSSGHISGGILLAALLGAFPAMIAMAGILTVQCLAFADGGPLALGANIFNLGVIPCLIVYPLVARLFARGGKTETSGQTVAASMVAAVVGLELGALAVAVLTHLSGVAALPLWSFAKAMLSIHLAIGLAESVITATILYAAYRATRPDTSPGTVMGTQPIAARIPVKTFVTAATAAAFVTGGALSRLASNAPDGLEWSIEVVAGANEMGS